MFAGQAIEAVYEVESSLVAIARWLQFKPAFGCMSFAYRRAATTGTDTDKHEQCCNCRDRSNSLCGFQPHGSN